MSDSTGTADDLFFAPGTEFDERERRRQAAEAFIYETTEDVLVCMEAAGVTRAELARRIDMNPSQLSRVLGGTQNMTLRTLSDLSHALGLAPRLVFEGPGAEALVVAPDPSVSDPSVPDAPPEEAEGAVAFARPEDPGVDAGVAGNAALDRWRTPLPDSPVDRRIRARTDNVIEVDFVVDEPAPPAIARP